MRGIASTLHQIRECGRLSNKLTAGQIGKQLGLSKSKVRNNIKEYTELKTLP